MTERLTGTRSYHPDLTEGAVDRQQLFEQPSCEYALRVHVASECELA
jgi:hypothetical protein